MQRLFASKFGQDLCEVRGRASTKNVFVNNAHKQASQMKSNGCRACPAYRPRPEAHKQEEL